MNYVRSPQTHVAKAGGGFVSVYRSEDQTPISSGSYLTIEFQDPEGNVMECNSMLIHNREAFGGNNLYVRFPNGRTPDTPFVIEPGYSISISKAWDNSIELTADGDNPDWQILVTI